MGNNLHLKDQTHTHILNVTSINERAENKQSFLTRDDYSEKQFQYCTCAMMIFGTGTWNYYSRHQTAIQLYAHLANCAMIHKAAKYGVDLVWFILCWNGASISPSALSSFVGGARHKWSGWGNVVFFMCYCDWFRVCAFWVRCYFWRRHRNISNWETEKRRKT